MKLQLRTTQECIIKPNSEFFQCFLKTVESLGPHQIGEADTSLSSANCRPVILHHSECVTLLHSHNRANYTSPQFLRSHWGLKNRIEYLLMQEVHDRLLFVTTSRV